MLCITELSLTQIPHKELNNSLSFTATACCQVVAWYLLLEIIFLLGNSIQYEIQWKGCEARETIEGE
ncbi:hypothetical protein EB796_015113 [Bugula neritina]|uniref:Uncharacterized protein n=1 Tax=Bugula neritina TaxID=10212 RepID=A0A7J7JL52_BUGNE|nr:hypothetical protein EB796_015113 [Bugula neritina]